MKTIQLNLNDKSLLTFAGWCTENGYTNDTQQSSHFYSACDRSGNVAEWLEDTNGNITSYLILYDTKETEVETLTKELEETMELRAEVEQKCATLLLSAARLFMETYHTDTIHFKEDEDGGDGRPRFIPRLEKGDTGVGDAITTIHFNTNGCIEWFTGEQGSQHFIVSNFLLNPLEIADLVLMQVRGEKLQ